MLKNFANCLLVLAIVSMVGCVGQPADLLKDAPVQYSIDGGETFTVTPPMIDPAQQVDIIVKAEFELTRPADIASVDLLHGQEPWVAFPFTLNGQAVKGPMAGMAYHGIPDIDGSLLAEGNNVLVGKITVVNGQEEAKAFEATLSMLAMKPGHLQFQTGPILGAYDDGYFTVSCRTTIPAEVTLRTTGGVWQTVATSDQGLLHRFRVPHRAGEKLRYRLEASRDGVKRKTPWYDVSLWGLESDEALRLIVMGDSRTRIDPWREVAAAARDADPDLVVFVGDMVTDGRNDWEWDEQFVGPSGDLFREVPMYPVIGNHENSAPVYNELFHSPTDDGRGLNWSQQIGDVLLIGIVGYTSFAVDTENYKWLEATLATSEAKFIFFFSHYPAWSSTRSAAVNEDGVAYDKITYQAQKIILPLLAKHGATAYFAGHDHFYERSEPDSGVSVVIVGGAGAPLYGRGEGWQANNPHSEAFAAELHYSLLEIDGDTCTMLVITPAGEIIDTRTWQAREPR